MAILRPFAFTTEFGFERVSVDALKRLRDQRGGEPLKRSFWSAAKAGYRRKVKHVIRDGTPFFSLVDPNSNGSGGDGGGGESLNHRLFKEAIARIKRTRLALDRYGDCQIEVVALSEMESRISMADGTPYYADVRLVFASDSPLCMKWGGQVYIEVHNTNAVHLEKRKDLHQRRVAVVEVDIPDIFTYKIADESTTDWLEDQHRERVIRILEGNGFLKGRVICDPSSIEYLEYQVLRQGEELRQVAHEKAKLSGEVDTLKKALSGLEGELSIKQSRIVSLESKNQQYGDYVATVTEQRSTLEDQLAQQKKAASKQKEFARDSAHKQKAERMTYLGIIAGLFLLWGLTIYILR